MNVIANLLRLVEGVDVAQNRAARAGSDAVNERPLDHAHDVTGHLAGGNVLGSLL